MDNPLNYRDLTTIKEHLLAWSSLCPGNIIPVIISDEPALKNLYIQAINELKTEVKPKRFELTIVPQET